MGIFAHAEGLSFPKKTALASKRDRPHVVRKRLRWKSHPGSVDIRRLVFSGESEPFNASPVRAQLRTAKPNKTPLRRWAVRGRRLIGKAPFGHRNTMTWQRGIVILDNLGSHKGPAIRNAIRPVGARLIFLPAGRYPDQPGLRQT